MYIFRIVVVIAGLVSMLAQAAADDVADFYKGKQIRMVIRAGTGGGFDTYSRLLIRHMVRFIPGNPTGLPVNMPGGSGLSALNYVADVHPRDGTVLTLATQTFPMEQALAINPLLKVDMGQLNWIGNMSEESSFVITSAESPTKTLDDAKQRDTIIGVPSLRSTTAWLALLTNRTLGTRFKLVAGYTSGPNMVLAMDRGEIEGRGTTTPNAVLGGRPTVDARGKPLINFIIQYGLAKNKGFPNVPLFRDLAVGADQKSLFDFVSSVVSLPRPIATNAGVPLERVAALRRAFDATMKDPAFLAEAQRMELEVSPTTGEELQKLITAIVNVSPDVIAKLKQVIE